MDSVLLVVFSITTGIVFATALLLRSIFVYSQTGPEIREEIRKRYRAYMALALVRLAGYSSLVIAWLAAWGGLVYQATAIKFGFTISFGACLGAGIIGMLTGISLQFLWQLFYIPGTIVMSSNYRLRRFYRLWRLLTANRLRWLRVWIMGGSSLVILWFGNRSDHDGSDFLVWWILLMIPVFAALDWPVRLKRNSRNQTGNERPNILMIGCDTLRPDHLSAAGYQRNTTPFLQSLCKKGRLFVNCYTPQARTAPSVVTLLTGVWPQHHGIRSNYPDMSAMKLSYRPLPSLLKERGYHTAVISDWAGGDFGKFDLGFMEKDLPDDQWNLKYLIRQGPKDIRLFLSLFVHNRLGKYILPEIFYLAGSPVNDQMGTAARRYLSRQAKNGHPFLLNVFLSTSHPPFGVEYPYYTLFANRDYDGDSKFSMSRLVDPFDIINSQREPREAFDLEQIIDLYDGCVRRFDDEVRAIVQHLKRCGLADNTIIVLYSDHGMELFEHDTWGQGNSAVGEASPRVPLFILDPRKADVQGGVDHRVIRTTDLMPTLLELCGLAVTDRFDGCSLIDYLHDRQCDYNLPAYFETGVWLARPPGQADSHLSYPGILDLLHIPDTRTGSICLRRDYETIVNRARDRMIRQGNWKLVYLPHEHGAQYMLFNLKSDPGCRRNVITEFPDVAQNLWARLEAWIGAECIAK